LRGRAHNAWFPTIIGSVFAETPRILGINHGL
jgi:hypothetical protein